MLGVHHQLNNKDKAKAMDVLFFKAIISSIKHDCLKYELSMLSLGTLERKGSAALPCRNCVLQGQITVFVNGVWWL